jgi:hypothetical protein
MEGEAIFYHSISIGAGGDYAAIRHVRRYGGNWQAAYKKFSQDKKVPAPEAAWKELKE